MKYRSYKKGGEVDPKYKKSKEKEQTPEEKLVQALRSQERGAGDLLTLLQAMRSPTEIERRAAMFSGEPLYEAPGRAFRGPGDRVLYQPATEEGELEGTGRAIGRGDVRTITGGRAELSGRQETDVARMLRTQPLCDSLWMYTGKQGRLGSQGRLLCLEGRAQAIAR